MLIEQLRFRLERSNSLYWDFVSNLDEKYLKHDLCGLPSNTIGQQLWCVIGARTSYIKAANARKWDGFECHLDWDKTSSKKDVLEKLDSTYNEIEAYFSSLEELCIEEANFLGDLLEHEIQHHGQLVRYIYGNKIEMPQSWKERYNLD